LYESFVRLFNFKGLHNSLFLRLLLAVKNLQISSVIVITVVDFLSETTMQNYELFHISSKSF
jgi:putative ribosome biogenesis GTPase RsgA